jgi:sterol desaturase/sphingolipid hydroxylase (fatty acid hydroxylase superfamily)
VVIVIENCFHSKVLPTREPGAPPVRYVSLDTRSIVYLTLNAFNEYAFVMRLTHYLWQGGHQQLLKWKLTEMTLGNTIIALGIMFVFMDMLYAPLHHMLHLPALYPLIHKHHHRQHYPTRGYLDAGNEHPIEHMIGTMCTWFALCVVEVFMPTCGMWIGRMKENGLRWMIEGGYSMPLTQGGGVHALTVFVFVQFHAALAMLNHSPYDVQFFLPCVGSSSICGAENTWFKRIITGQWFEYSVGYHEMHHRKFNFNYGQNCMLYDTLMGTFLNYEGPKSAAELGAKRGKELKEK